MAVPDGEPFLETRESPRKKNTAYETRRRTENCGALFLGPYVRQAWVAPAAIKDAMQSTSHETPNAMQRASRETQDAMNNRLLTGIALAVFGLACGTASAAAPGVTFQSLRGDYDEVKDRIVMAIENRGMVVDHTSHVGDMLERTGKDIGRPRQVYLKADVIQFCSAAVSRSTMEADPRNLVFCPYAIAVYVLPAEADRVYVLYRKPPASGSAQSVKALREVGKLLDGIVREALK